MVHQRFEANAGCSEKFYAELPRPEAEKASNNKNNRMSLKVKADKAMEIVNNKAGRGTIAIVAVSLFTQS